jgi:hypothetical protein
MPLVRIAVLLVTLCFATSAAAGGDVCLIDEANQTGCLLKRLKARGGDAMPSPASASPPRPPACCRWACTLLRQPDELLLGLTPLQRCPPALLDEA